MTTRITLISSGTTTTIRNATFGGDGPLEAGEQARAAALISRLPRVDRILCGTDSASRQTTEALALSAAPEVSWREVDFGEWTGKTVSTVQTETPEALAAWLSDPTSSPPSGESIAAFTGRIGQWLDRHRDQQEKTLIVASANCLRAAMLHCLSAPPQAFLSIDIAPLTMIHISAYRGLWRLRLGHQHEGI